MGSSNGVTRGQLRPYFSGRTPPFILVGTLIILIIFGFSYWSLNSQYNDLQLELHEFQDQLRAAAQKRLESEKRFSSLQDQQISAQESFTKCKNGLEKKEEEIAEISQQLRDDATKASSQLEEIRMNLEKCEEEKSRRQGECSKQQEHTKLLDAENAELKKVQDTLKEKINSLENAVKQMNTQQHPEVKNPLPNSVANQEAIIPKVPKVEENDTHVEGNKVEGTPGNPDVGIPPGSDGGNDIQDNSLPKSIPERPVKEAPVQPGTGMVNDDTKRLNGVQSRSGEEPKNFNIPMQQYASV